MKRVIVLIFLLICILPVLASSLEAGAVFLMIFPGSRATSMAGAFTAVEGDIFSTYYNDASLAFADKKMLGLQHANWLPGLYPGMYYEYLSFLWPVAGDINLSGAVIYLTTGETEAGDTLGSRWEWITYDVAVKLAGSMPISKNLGVSVGMKYIYSFLAPEEVIEWLSRLTGITMSGGSGQAWAIDMGMYYKWSTPFNLEAFGKRWFETISFGLMVQNLGTDIKYIEEGESDPLPRTLRLGTSLNILDDKMHKVRMNLDLIKIVVNIEDYTDFSGMWEDTWKAFGMEYTFNDLFSIRWGYFIDRVGQRVGPTFGAGFQYKAFRFDLSVDQEIYEFQTQNYRLSAQYSF